MSYWARLSLRCIIEGCCVSVKEREESEPFRCCERVWRNFHSQKFSVRSSRLNSKSVEVIATANSIGILQRSRWKIHERQTSSVCKSASSLPCCLLVCRTQFGELSESRTYKPIKTNRVSPQENKQAAINYDILTVERCWSEMSSILMCSTCTRGKSAEGWNEMRVVEYWSFFRIHCGIFRLQMGFFGLSLGCRLSARPRRKFH